jgi:haloalkane dehalogenase
MSTLSTVAARREQFPFESKFLKVSGFSIHFIEVQGRGNPLLFIHGNPTWSYIWRNIIPPLSKLGRRCVAFDLLGLGKSDKPQIEYTFDQCYDIVRGFIEEMGLKNLVLVLHDWGGAFGFWYAIQNRPNVKGIVAMEPVLLPLTWDDYEGERKELFKSFRNPAVSYDLIQVKNTFIETMPNRVWNKERMTDGVMKKYREPFSTPESRKAIRRFPEMLPIGQDSETFQIFQKIESSLSSLSVPVLLLKVTPGALINEKKLGILKEKIRDLTVKELGPGLHYVQEDYPDEIAGEIASWTRLKNI